MDKQKFVIDKIGFISLVDKPQVNPLIKIVNSARVSFNRDKNSDEYELNEKDLKLIKYLYDNGHYSVFRHSYFTFLIKAPLFVFRQWWKYQVGSHWEHSEAIIIPETNWNEVSGRYVSFDDPEYYIPSARIQSESNKQGSIELDDIELDKLVFDSFNEIQSLANIHYSLLRENNIAKEIARGLLSQNIYSRAYWTCSLQTIMFFLGQRLKDDAQYEIRQYAIAIKESLIDAYPGLKILL
jgi:thymidylate synthase (FAD)